MRRLVLAAVLVASLSTPAVADDDPMLVDLFTRWSDKVLAELRLPDAPTPTRAVFSAYDYTYYAARASFGGLVTESRGRRRPAKVEVVVGDDALNSSRFRTGRRASETWDRLDLVVEDVPIAVERDLWMATDGSYKKAVATLQAKTAGRASVGGEPPMDWSSAPAVRSVNSAPIIPIDEAPLRRIAEDASSKLRDLGGLDRASVRVRSVQGNFIVVDSEGTVVVQPAGYAVVRAYASVRRSDGVLVDDERQWVVRSVADLPGEAELTGAVEELGSAVLRRAGQDPVDYYEGPVVFEGVASADFFRHLLPPELRGTPPVPSASESYERATRSGPRIGRRLLPAGWSVLDDPTSAGAGMPGGFTHDNEGVAARAVSLVEDGRVRSFVMSRVPRKELGASNGHARGAVQSNWEGRLSVWTVMSSKSLPSKRFGREVESLRRASGQDRILVVRRMGRTSEGRLPRPTEAVWRAPDGTETPALSLMFQNVDRRTLRDVRAATGRQERPYLAPFDAGRRAGTDSGLPMVVTTPRAVLVDNLEVVFPGPDEKPYALPMDTVTAER